MIRVDRSTQEFIAKNIADLGKAILTVGFASYFFEGLPINLRIGFVVLGIVCIVISIIIHAWKGET